MCRILHSPLGVDVHTAIDIVVAREEGLLGDCNELAIANITVVREGIRSELDTVHVLEIPHGTIAVRHVLPCHHPH